METFQDGINAASIQIRIKYTLNINHRISQLFPSIDHEFTAISELARILQAINQSIFEYPYERLV